MISSNTVVSYLLFNVRVILLDIKREIQFRREKSIPGWTFPPLPVVIHGNGAHYLYLTDKRMHKTY